MTAAAFLRACRILAAAVAVVLSAGGTAAQELASLVADEISVDPSGRLTARGNVEIWYEGTRLLAEEVSYQRTGDTLSITGPIVVTAPDGTVFRAEEATLDRRLREGLLVSARLVIDRQLQLAAAEIARTGDRYTRLDRVVASSCQVCPENPTPLWEIRASRVVHDQRERQLYFTDAQVRVVGLPVLWVPRLRLPDPTLDRATGLLVPQFKNSSVLGTGIKLPYFVALGRYADVTLTPYLSAETRTLEFGYRHNLRFGAIAARGAISEDDLEGDRAYLFAEALYRLPRGFIAEAQLELVSDPGYLFTYNYSEKDRLANWIGVKRVRDKDRFFARATEFRTLRESEIPIRDTLTDRFAEVSYERELEGLGFGGRTFLEVGTTALDRPSDTDVAGRDVTRVGARLTWRRDEIFGPGIVATGVLGFGIDAYNIEQDSNYDQFLTRAVPRAALELRWPLSRETGAGVTEVLQPVVRVDWASADGDEVPLEDSRIVEFDEANLFAFTRYPGIDGVEDGTRIAVGASWQRQDPGGWDATLAVGRIERLDGDLGFSEGTGLEGEQSEWLIGGQLALGTRFWLVQRSLLNDEFDFTFSETRVDWAGERVRVGTSYLFAEPEPVEGRDEQLSEWAFSGSYALTDRWTSRAAWRYDLAAGEATRAELGLGYRNECVNVDVSVSRRFPSSANLSPATEVGFRVSLLGIGDEESRREYRRTCRG